MKNVRFKQNGCLLPKTRRWMKRLKMYVFAGLFCLLFLLAQSIGISVAGDSIFPVELPDISLAGGAVLIYPDYIGSNDYKVGAAPFFRYQFSGYRYVNLIANELRVNLIDDAHWSFGPSAVYRFGRKDVEDDVVKRVHQFDDSFALGGFAGYQWFENREPLKKIAVSAFFQTDVTSTATGWTTGASMYASYPVSRPVVLMAGAGTTYGSSAYMNEYFGVTPLDTQSSGLKTFNAGEGFRDARGWVGAMFNLTPQWHLMTTVLYSDLLGDAADSPIVSDRGSSNQWVCGAGVLYSW